VLFAPPCVEALAAVLRRVSAEVSLLPGSSEKVQIMKGPPVYKIYCSKCGKFLFETELTEGEAYCVCGGVTDLAKNIGQLPQR